MHLGGLLSTQEARVALGYASSNCASFVQIATPLCTSVTRLFYDYHVYHFLNESGSLFERKLWTAAWLAQWDKCWSAEREAVGSNPRQTNTQGLKLTEEKVLPL